MSHEEKGNSRAYEKISVSKPKEKKSKLVFLKNISVEPCIALFGLGYSLIGVQASTLYLEKTCKVGSYFFGNKNETFSIETCDNLFNGSFVEEQKIVQSVTAKVHIVTQILNTIPMAIFALFLGPWSDKAGRKMLIMLPFLGYFLNCLSFLVNIYFFEQLVVEFLWFESISSFFGGFAVLFIGAYGFIADTTSLKSRTIRLGVLDGTIFVSETIGSFINGYVFAACGYYGSYGLASACYLLGLAIAFFTVHNKKNPENKETKALNIKNVLESFKVLLKPRVGSMRHIVIILVICFQIGMFSAGGASYIDYLYVRRKFGSEFPGGETALVKFFSQLISFKSGISIVSLFVILPILVVFKFHDMSIVILATICSVLKNIIFCFATSKNWLYAVLGIALFDSLFAQPLRSTLTKIVGPADVGKVFAVVGSLQAMMGFASPIFNMIYINTLDTYVGTVYIIICGFYAVLLALLGYTFFFLKNIDYEHKIDLVPVTKSQSSF